MACKSERALFIWEKERGPSVKIAGIISIAALLLSSCLSGGSYGALQPEDRWGTLEEFAYDSVDAAMYNDLLKRLDQTDLQLNVRPKHNVVAIYYKDYLSTNCIRISDRNRMVLLDYLGKYIEWNSIALQSGDTIKKEIGQFKYSLSWKLADEWFSESFGDEASNGLVTFFSQNPKIHQVVITFSKSHSYSNEYLTKSPQQLYLDYEQVTSLRNKLALEYIKDKVAAQTAKMEEGDTKYK